MMVKEEIKQEIVDYNDNFIELCDMIKRTYKHSILFHNLTGQEIDLQNLIFGINLLENKLLEKIEYFKTLDKVSQT